MIPKKKQRERCPHLHPMTGMQCYLDKGHKQKQHEADPKEVQKMMKKLMRFCKVPRA